jgi:hypothetical protein
LRAAAFRRRHQPRRPTRGLLAGSQASGEPRVDRIDERWQRRRIDAIKLVAERVLNLATSRDGA